MQPSRQSKGKSFLLQLPPVFYQEHWGKALLILGVQPQALQSEPWMDTPTKKELQTKHEPTMSDLHLSDSLFSPHTKVLTIKHFEMAEAQ